MVKGMRCILIKTNIQIVNTVVNFLWEGKFLIHGDTWKEASTKYT